MCASALPVVLPNDGSGTGSAPLRRANATCYRPHTDPRRLISRGSKEGVPASCGRVRCDRSGTGSARLRRANAHNFAGQPRPTTRDVAASLCRRARLARARLPRPDRTPARRGRAEPLLRGSPTRSACGSGFSGETAHAYPPRPSAFASAATRPGIGSALSAPSHCSRCRRARPCPRWLAVQLGGLLGAGPRAGARPRPMRARRGRNRAAPSPRRRRAGDAAGRSRRVIGFANPSRPAILLRIGATSPTCPVQSGPHLPRESIPLPCSTRGGPVSAAAASVVAFSRHQPRSTGLRMRDVRRPGGSPVPSSAPVRSMLVAASGRGKRGAGSVARLQAEATTRRRKGLSVTKG